MIKKMHCNLRCKIFCFPSKRRLRKREILYKIESMESLRIFKKLTRRLKVLNRNIKNLVSLR